MSDYGLNDFQRQMLVSWLPPGSRFVLLSCDDPRRLTIETNLDPDGVQFMLEAGMRLSDNGPLYTLPVPAGDNVFATEQFIDMCNEGLIKEGDGHGYPVKAGFRSEQVIVPDNLKEIPNDATHIYWVAREENLTGGEKFDETHQ